MPQRSQTHLEDLNAKRYATSHLPYQQKRTINNPLRFSQTDISATHIFNHLPASHTYQCLANNPTTQRSTSKD